ncbi:DegT/DnrJ/EryC1/StrS aminotransferase family protein [Nocardioides sp. YIM 152315]|uniref:DegT/DnrJ/EryC1/StrS family aminotransferase n=1 Tax=Nocardioides sp. YIM 152315 TaxID=3031760 RepID=UPI0023DB4898|nr:DegT/DnrJ/EryC1/StrS aminotransferase family protein [Nocardioides sp. YIM 152315]MDF1604298.1 DegT/DnrJ/EryC1/StrS aminotransferase family protein [Nocardioides sp. YIM 152315]
MSRLADVSHSQRKDPVITTTADDPIPFAQPDVGDAEADAVRDAIRAGWLTTGRITAEFEREFAEAVGAAHAVAVTSATAALHLALEAAGVGPGDEVLVPTWTFTASAEVVRYLGADPVMVDVDASTMALDLERAAKAVTDRTKAVVPVHFAGLPMDPAALSRFARDHGLQVVEDAAHAFPAGTDGRPVGGGDSAATAFSFYSTKTMTTGEGGMLTTNDDAIAARARIMRLHGIDRDVLDRYTRVGAKWQYDVVAPGYKYNLTDIASALGRVQLSRAPGMRQRREVIARRYTEAFADLPLQLPAGPADNVTHAWHLYSVRLRDAAIDRDEFVERMGRSGVATSVHFIPLHKMSYWRERFDLRDADFPVATESFARAVSLPISSSLTDAQVERVVSTVRDCLTTE